MNYNQKVLVGLLILFFIIVIIYASSENNQYDEVNSSLLDKFNSNLEQISVKNNNLKVILINLDNRKDRLQSLITGYHQSDLSEVTDLYRLSAIDGRKQLDDILPLMTENATKEFSMYQISGKRVGHHSLTEGGLGCYMSHVLAWKNVKEFGVPCIVAEDDIFIPTNTYDKINEIIQLVEDIPRNRPYIILFHSICKSHNWDKLECVPIENGLYKANQFWSTAFYYVTPEAAAVMLDNIFPIHYQIDHAMSKWNRDGLIDIFYKKNIVDMAIYDSDIQAPLLE
jgi:GR25 family glycosyltransferase involved in LPS biosynthesis